MTPKELREQFMKETGLDVCFQAEYSHISYTGEYVEWLEKKAQETYEDGRKQGYTECELDIELSV